MKTPQEWLAHIKHLSDTEVRHGSTVILLASDIEEIIKEAEDAMMARMLASQRVIYGHTL